jgi:hypothetical protein
VQNADQDIRLPRRRSWFAYPGDRHPEPGHRVFFKARLPQAIACRLARAVR